MFHFKLQAVLDYRKLLEEKLMFECAEARRRLDDERETLQRMRREVADLVLQLKSRGERRLSAPDVSFYLSYINHLKGEGRRQEGVVSRIGEKLEKKRMELAEAAGNRRVLEIMREKRFREYKTYVNDREQKELDEAAVLRSGGGEYREEADSYL